MTSGSFCTCAGSPSAIFLPVIENGDAVAQTHDQLDVVLDQQNGHAVVANFFQEPAQLRRFRRVHSRRGLVERQQLRFRGKSACDFQPALIAVGEIPRQRAGVLADADIAEQFPGRAADGSFLVARAARAQDRTDRACVRAHMPPDHHVFDGRHVAEQADILERPCDAGFGDAIRFETDQIRAVEFELTAVRHIQPGEHVEQRGLAGAVRSDQPIDFPVLDGQRNIGERRQPAEALFDMTDLEQYRCLHQLGSVSANSRLRRFEGQSPAGR